MRWASSVDWVDGTMQDQHGTYTWNDDENDITDDWVQLEQWYESQLAGTGTWYRLGDSTYGGLGATYGLAEVAPLP